VVRPLEPDGQAAEMAEFEKASDGQAYFIKRVKKPEHRVS
jgi:hypothetical protein